MPVRYADIGAPYHPSEDYPDGPPSLLDRIKEIRRRVAWREYDENDLIWEAIELLAEAIGERPGESPRKEREPDNDLPF